MSEPSIVSFVEGRVRLRHRALKNAALAEQARHVLPQLPGMLEVNINQRTGSALLQYDPAEWSKDSLLGLLRQWEENNVTGTGLASPVSSRCTVRRLVNRGMLASLAASVVLGFRGQARAHVLAGGLFLAFGACHVWNVRRSL